MSNRVVFMLDEDKVFMNLYSRLLESKGWQVFATDNLYLLMKYARTAEPEWIFIDQDFAKHRESEIAKILDKAIPLKNHNYAIMSRHKSASTRRHSKNMDFVYKPNMQSELDCIVFQYN